jgi:amino-acid N-acetyltransferase
MTEKELQRIEYLINLGAKEGKILPRTLKELYKVRDSFFFYKINNEIVACAALEIYTKRLAEIRSLYVLPDFRGQGLAKELIQLCITRAIKRHVKEIVAVTDKIELFREFGFTDDIKGQSCMFLKLCKR